MHIQCEPDGLPKQQVCVHYGSCVDEAAACGVDILLTNVVARGLTFEGSFTNGFMWDQVVMQNNCLQVTVAASGG